MKAYIFAIASMFILLLSGTAHAQDEVTYDSTGANRLIATQTNAAAADSLTTLSHKDKIQPKGASLSGGIGVFISLNNAESHALNFNIDAGYKFNKWFGLYGDLNFGFGPSYKLGFSADNEDVPKFMEYISLTAMPKLHIPISIFQISLGAGLGVAAVFHKLSNARYNLAILEGMITPDFVYTNELGLAVSGQLQLSAHITPKAAIELDIDCQYDLNVNNSELLLFGLLFSAAFSYMF